MASAFEPRRIIPYAVLIAAWVVVYACFEAFLPTGSDHITYSTFFFFTEFAVFFVLAMLMGGELSASMGLGFRDTFTHYLAFFAIFAAIGLLATLGSSLINLDKEILFSALIFLVFAVVKFFLGLIALAIGAYLHKALKAKPESYRNMLLAASVAIVLIIGALSYMAGRGIAQSISFTSSPGYSDTVDKCAVGEWGYGNFFGATLNTTVRGLTTYRNREVCHSNGSGLVYGAQMTYDSYMVTQDDYCTVTVTSSNTSGTTTRERCYGVWPGYNGTG